MVRHHHKHTSAILRMLVLTGILCLPTGAHHWASAASLLENAASDSGAAGETGAAAVVPFQSPEVTLTTNLHYTGEYCSECHEKTPMAGGDPYLRFNGDYGVLCRCHADSASRCVHPSGTLPSALFKGRIPGDLPLEKGKVTCLTCHDIYLQCQKQVFKKSSVRGAPYPTRSDFCFLCHTREEYEAVDPHKQVDEKGTILPDTCLLCHREKPDEKKDTYKDVTFVGEIEETCRRCHHVSGNHAGDHDHIGVVPSEKGMKRITAMEVKYNARLPLDADGKMTCITCHNPHAKGVIPEENSGELGADSRYRLRLPGDICRECHQM